MFGLSQVETERNVHEKIKPLQQYHGSVGMINIFHFAFSFGAKIARTGYERSVCALEVKVQALYLSALTDTRYVTRDDDHTYA